MDQRCAVVINAWDESTAQISVIYFPGTYASMKEKPIIEDVIQNLLKMNPLPSDDSSKSGEMKH